MLYNTYMKQTYVATQDSLIYVVSRNLFKMSMQQDGARGGKKGSSLRDYQMPLEEVHMLSPLLRVGRR